jgi:transcriptional regulator with XRE-family HTH domain
MSADDEVRRIASLLNAQLRSRKVTKRSIEQRMGWSHGYMTRLTSGAIELKLRHVLDILEVIGVSATEFFREAYGADSPPLPAPPPAPQAVQAAGEVRIVVLGEDELERRIESLIQKISGRQGPAGETLRGLGPSSPKDDPEHRSASERQIFSLEHPRRQRS